MIKHSMRIAKTFGLLFETLRPAQWPKNLLLFAGVLFSQHLFVLPFFLRALAAFVIFSLLSGCVYIFNDLADAERDRQHPLKSSRPIASRRLDRRTAIVFLCVNAVLCMTCAYMLDWEFFIIACGYALLQLLYTLYLKNMVILDVCAIAAGFVLRVIAGAVLFNVEISFWLMICTTLLALFMGFGKRRHELVSMESNAKSHRAVLQSYSPYLLDQMISVVTATTVMAYILYTVSDVTVAKFGTNKLLYTAPFVLYGIFRYLYLVHQEGMGGRPEIALMSDRPLLLGVLGWIFAVILVLYRKSIFG